MENTGQIIRSKKTGKSRYTPISNEILQSEVLEPEEKSILVHLLSLPEDWVVYKTQIWKHMNIGRDRFDKHWKGLVKKGYIVSIKSIKANGQFAGYNHIVYEEPVLPNNQLTENQGTVNQVTGDQVTEIQLTGFQGTEIQGVNKVISEESNKIEKNNIESNNIETYIVGPYELGNVEGIIKFMNDKNIKLHRSMKPSDFLHNPNYRNSNYQQREQILINSNFQ